MAAKKEIAFKTTHDKTNVRGEQKTFLFGFL
jgi:hypothetical protein